MRYTRPIARILAAAICFLWACHRPGHLSVPAPESGEFCYKTDSSSPEYLQLTIHDGKVEGRLLNMSENAVLIKTFSGTIVHDSDPTGPSTLQVNVSYADVSSDKTWVIWFEKEGVRVKYDANAMEFTPYISMPNEDFSMIFGQLNETILSYKSTGFRLPKGTPVCYEAVRPANGSYLSEYFQLWITNGKVKGRGAGYYLGEPVWDFDFHGKLIKKTMMLTVNYRKQGEVPHSVLETWTMDPESKRIFIKNNSPSVLSAGEYVETKCENFLNFVHSYFKKEDRVR